MLRARGIQRLRDDATANGIISGLIIANSASTTPINPLTCKATYDNNSAATTKHYGFAIRM